MATVYLDLNASLQCCASRFDIASPKITIDWHQLQNPIKEADLQIIFNLGCKRRSQRQFLKLLLLLILDSESLELVE